MSFSCPQCGFTINIQHSKLSICASCDSSLLINNDSVSISDLKVVKNTHKSLFEVGKSIRIKNSDYIPKGYSLYNYGLHQSLHGNTTGNRVEWELTRVDNDPIANESTTEKNSKTADKNADTKQNEHYYFLNQEDENLFLVKQIPNIQQTLPAWESLQPNTQLKINETEWLVVEQLEVNFIGYYGALQNLPLQNNKLKCSYLSNTEGECLVITFTKNGLTKNTVKAFQGWWLDPMDLS